MLWIDMSINEILEKIKPFYTIILLVLVAMVFFVLGHLYGLKRGDSSIKISYPNSTETSSVINSFSTTTNDSSQKVNSVSIQTSSTGEVIGSKSGKKYYFPWCGTVKRIKPENQIHFASIDEARKAGFTPGGNCKGLK